MLCLTPLYIMQLKLHLLDTAGKTAEASNSAIDAKSITEKAKIQETQKSKTIFNCQTHLKKYPKILNMLRRT